MEYPRQVLKATQANSDLEHQATCPGKAGYRARIHVPASGYRSLKTSQPSPEIPILCSSRHWYILPRNNTDVQGRICVPIDSSDPEIFDPLSVPTVTSLLGEIDSWEKGQEANPKERISDWEKTSLKDYIRYFKQHVDRIMADERGVKKEREEELGGMAISGKMLDF